jgi:hypothetical protein
VCSAGDSFVIDPELEGPLLRLLEMQRWLPGAGTEKGQ